MGSAWPSQQAVHPQGGNPATALLPGNRECDAGINRELLEPTNTQLSSA